MRTLVMAGLISVLLSGCYARGMSYQEAPLPESGRATLHVYRAEGGPGFLVSAEVLVDSHKIASLPQAGYSWFYAEEGRHDIEVKLGFLARVRAVGGIKKGESIFLKISAGTREQAIPPVGDREAVTYSTLRNGMKVHTSIHLIKAETALTELARYRYEKPVVETVPGGP